MTILLGNRPTSPEAAVTGDARATLRLADQVVAEYTWRPDLPVALSPRPYLHPVRTLGGICVTELMPASHRHHLGVSVAVAEVDGANFWGGRTFIPGHGPAWLDNQGTQAHARWLRRTPEQIGHTLRWTGIDGALLLTERREISARRLADDAWALDFGFTLSNAADRDMPVRSPAVHGRPGAGYGGFFWRAPAPDSPVRIDAESGSGVEATHGRTSRWLSVHGGAWTLVFIGGTERTRSDRWFVRTRDYLGIGSALSWDEPLVLAPGSSLTRRMVTVIADGTLSPERAAAYADELAS
ncbi:PmoA family protein [Actinoplanes hulinensis]|uniref:PmoA family protein n=1 Tax=Actinoplanes hulinensis TaxID=1144547 RepID=A0ABS7BD83_9ACTN|nr:PmoA family protein [Actinoplanes hulinensis]MBW6438867.1 PmoA family protein [Actinoplanes hulinensis]